MNKKKTKVLLVSAFYESSMPSLREHQYSRALVEGGFDVTLFVSSGSNVWKYSRSRMKPTIPNELDKENSRRYGFTVIRRRALVRISDFFIIIPPIFLILKSDIVHVIEFRQGFTAIIALIAKMAGKKVIYDHEQRGDRKYTVLHRIDSMVRRVLIHLGSLAVDHVRHTVYANKEHFLKNSFRKVDMTFAPLGADEDYFYFSQHLRKITREKLGVDREDERVLLITGKITDIKRPVDVVRAAVSEGFVVVIVGRIDQELENSIRKAGGRKLRLLGWQPMAELNKFYCASDVVVFTAFSVSYWEAAATGVQVVVPRSSFSQMELDSKEQFHLFGTIDMFDIEDESISQSFDIEASLLTIFKNLQKPCTKKRKTNNEWLWVRRRSNLVEWYKQKLKVIKDV